MAVPDNQTQVEQVREIANASDLSDVATRIAALTDEAWTLTVSDISEWAKYKNKFSELEGGKFGLKKDPAVARLEIRNRVRVRLGYSKVDNYGKEINPKGNTAQSVNVPIEGW